jgi:drug/metabolite transporter (DMT)-like permease
MSNAAVGYALAAALLFGLSTPAAKILVGAVDPWMLAGLFYLGAGIGLGGWRLLAAARRRSGEASLGRRDLPWLAGAIAAGGVLGPVLLMAGLARVEASAASLLLTLEGVATALLAWFLFREHFDRRIALGMGAIAAGAAILAWQGGPSLSGLAGPAAILGACVAWGIDNNLTRRVALADPVAIAMLKGLVAGPVNIALAMAQGVTLPGFGTAGVAGLVGLLGYGVSLALFVRALRHLGAARTGAYFSTAPFLGALAAISLLGETVSVQLVLAGILMGIGVYLHLTERHAHVHEHEPMTHNHRHAHDAHHRHGHGPQDPPGEPHTHLHVHVRLRHSHAHVPDMHHRHRH